MLSLQQKLHPPCIVLQVICLQYRHIAGSPRCYSCYTLPYLRCQRSLEKYRLHSHNFHSLRITTSTISSVQNRSHQQVWQSISLQHRHCCDRSGRLHSLLHCHVSPTAYTMQRLLDVLNMQLYSIAAGRHKPDLCSIYSSTSAPY